MDRNYDEYVPWQREYIKFKDRQHEVEDEYRNTLQKSDIFEEIRWLMYCLRLPEVSHSREEQIDLLKVKRNVLLETKKFLDGVNLDVRIISHDVIKQIREMFSHNGEHDVKIWDASRRVSVFDIPLSSNLERDCFVSNYRCTEGDYRNVVFCDIQIGSFGEPRIAQADYAHELGHVLTLRNIDSFLNPAFTEYMPIILELFYLYFGEDGDRLYNERCIGRFHHRRHGSLYGDEFSYLVSFLLAIITFEQFMDSTTEDKQRIISEFKRILNGQLSIENFLMEGDINLTSDKSLKFVKRTVDRIHS